MDTRQKRTWVEIDLDRIAHNYKELCACLPAGCRCMGIVKANAYGHGAAPVAQKLESIGCTFFAVATVDEAVALRQSGIRGDILILGCTSPEFTGTLLEYDLIQAVTARDSAEAFSRLAAASGRKLRVHLKADSGMGRLGFTCHHGQDPAPDMLAVMGLPGLETEGIFTHFAVSDTEGGETYTELQFGDFCRLTQRLEEASGRRFKIRHCANSGAVISYPQTYLDMVRPGIALYGLYPGKAHGRLHLLPVMSLKTRIVQIKDFDAGYTVSYGRAYRAPAPRRIAVIPIGYNDGLHRCLSGKLQMLVHGQRVPQTGRICMDMCMIDVTDVPDAAVGDVVTVFGHDGDAFVSPDELAEAAGTISYEILGSVSPRVERIYIQDGVSL